MNDCNIDKMGPRPTFTTVTMKLDTKGRSTAPIIGPLMGKVRDYGDGKEKDAMLSIPTSEMQAYFEAIDALKSRLGFTTTHDDLVRSLEDALLYIELTDSEGKPPLKSKSMLATNLINDIKKTLAKAIEETQK